VRLSLRSRDGAAESVFLLMNDDINLYVGVDAVSDTTHTSRESRRAFDNIAVWFKAQEGRGFWLYGDGRLRTERILTGAIVGTIAVSSVARGAVLGPPAVANMMYELLVPLGEIGIQAGDGVAMGLHYWDTYDTGPSFWWPRNVDVFPPERYGRLVTTAKP
jgi:hypothetical protein